MEDNSDRHGETFASQYLQLAHGKSFRINLRHFSCSELKAKAVYVRVGPVQHRTDGNTRAAATVLAREFPAFQMLDRGWIWAASWA